MMRKTFISMFKTIIDELYVSLNIALQIERFNIKSLKNILWNCVILVKLANYQFLLLLPRVN